MSSRLNLNSKYVTKLKPALSGTSVEIILMNRKSETFENQRLQANSSTTTLLLCFAGVVQITYLRDLLAYSGH